MEKKKLLESSNEKMLKSRFDRLSNIFQKGGLHTPILSENTKIDGTERHVDGLHS